MTRPAWPMLLLAAGLLAAPARGIARPADQSHVSTEALLDALQHAPNSQAALPLELALRERWLKAGSPAVMLLMSRGLRELKAGENNEAVKDFGDAIVLQPKFAAAYHQRAIARYRAGDVSGAITDLEAALRLEPRDFAAWQTLSEIAEAQQNWKGAYEAWQKVLQVDPMISGGQDRLKELKHKAFGEET